MTRTFARTLTEVAKQWSDQDVVARLRRAGIGSVSKLADRAKHARGDAATFYVWLLARFAGPQPEAVMLAVLRGNRRSLWMQAAVSLCSVGTTRAVPVLIRLVEHGGHPRQREASAYALGCMDSGSRGPAVVATLVRVLMSADVPRVRAQAAESVIRSLRFRRGGLRTASERALIAHLTDESPDVRFWCAYAVGELRVKAAVPVLQRLVRDRTPVPGWWSVGLDARDALCVIAGGAWPDRRGAP